MRGTRAKQLRKSAEQFVMAGVEKHNLAVKGLQLHQMISRAYRMAKRNYNAANHPAGKPFVPTKAYRNMLKWREATA